MLIMLITTPSLKAEAHGLLAGQWGSAFETTTDMRKEGGSLDYEYLLGF